MAVELTDTSANFIGTGIASTYAAPIYANDDDQVYVYVDGVLKTLGDDYVLNGLGSASGISILATFANGAAVYVERRTPIKQEVDTQNNETILEDVLDETFDKLTMMTQERAGETARAILVPRGQTGFALDTTGLLDGDLFQFSAPGTLKRVDRAPFAGKYYGGDVTGKLVPLSGTGNDTALRSDLASQIGGTLISYWRNVTGFVSRSFTAKLYGYVDVEDFGAVGNGVFDDTLAWARAIAFVDGKGLKLRAMSTSYLVSTIPFTGSNYEVATTQGNLFKQKSGLTGDLNVHAIWAVTGNNLKFGDASFLGNIATDVDEYSHAVTVGPSKNIEFGVLNGKDIRGDVLYVYARLGSGEAELSRGIQVAGVTGDNILRCIVAVTGGQGKIGFIRRVGSMRVGYRDFDAEPNNVVGTTFDYQPIDFEIGHLMGAEVQVVSADADIQNYSVRFGSMDLDGSRLANSVPPYSGSAGALAFALSVDDVLSFDGGDMRVVNYGYSPLKIGKKVGRYGFKSLYFANNGAGDGTYKSIILHLGTDRPNIVAGGLVTGTLLNNLRYIFRSDSQYLNVDIQRVVVTGGLFGSRVSGRVAGMSLDCGNTNGEIVFSDCDGMQFGTTVVTNSALAYGFAGCNNMAFFDFVGTFGAGLDYGASTNLILFNSGLNGSTVDGINLLLGASLRVSGIKVVGAQGALIADAAVSVAAPTKVEFDALVGKFNTLLARVRAHGLIAT